MASQTEIHLNPNDVINAAEGTFLSCVGKRSHVSLNIHSCVHMWDCIQEHKYTNCSSDKCLIDMLFSLDPCSDRDFLQKQVQKLQNQKVLFIKGSHTLQRRLCD